MNISKVEKKYKKNVILEFSTTTFQESMPEQLLCNI